MDSNNPTRVQLPSIKNLVDTLPPPNVYRSLQVTPEFAPLSQRRALEDAGGFSGRPLHASPAPPSRPAAPVSSTANYGHHGQQDLPHQAISNDVIQARAYRTALPSASFRNQRRGNQDQFYGRSSRPNSPSSSATSASMDVRRSSDDSMMTTSQHHARAQGQMQGQGSYGLSSNPHSRGFGDRPPSAFISAPDRSGVSHQSVHDLRALSASETQSRTGRLYLKPNSERILPVRNGQEYDGYDNPPHPGSWDPQGRRSFGGEARWDTVSVDPALRIPKSNTQPSRHRDYDTPTVERTRHHPDSVDYTQQMQRGREPVNYQERSMEQYSSRPAFNLEPARWQRDYEQEDGRNGASRAPYHSNTGYDSHPSSQNVGPGRGPSRSGNEGWASAHTLDRPSGRRPDYSEQENHVPRQERLHPSLEMDRSHKKRRAEGAGDEASYHHNRSAPSAPQASNRSVSANEIPRSRSKEDLNRVLVELTNEARAATQEGDAMKKIHEFSDAIAHFGSYAKQQASRATFEDWQEMALRIELVYRMARELQKGRKRVVATPQRSEPVAIQPTPVVQPPTKNAISKEEKRMLEDMEKIRKKRTSAQQGIKSKYTKRNKKTQPPKKCSSCGIKETPEWRKGPEGPRSLCNACGLHYAKLMRNRSSANEGKWIGTGSAPPIDIVTLRQVTGVGIQPQANERGEYEIPGIYTHIPPSRMLHGPFIPSRRNPPSSSSQPAAQGQASSSTQAQPISTTLATVNEEIAQTSSAVDDTAVISPERPPESKGKKRKAPSEDDEARDDVLPPTKRQRVISPQEEDVRMQESTASIEAPAEPLQSPRPADDSSGERSF